MKFYLRTPTQSFEIEVPTAKESLLQCAKLLRGETQGDLISSTQEEPFQLIGERCIDGEAILQSREAKEINQQESDKEQKHLWD